MTAMNALLVEIRREAHRARTAKAAGMPQLWQIHAFKLHALNEVRKTIRDAGAERAAGALVTALAARKP